MLLDVQCHTGELRPLGVYFEVTPLDLMMLYIMLYQGNDLNVT